MPHYLYAQRVVQSTIPLPELPSAPPQEPEFRISRIQQPMQSAALDWDHSLTASPTPGGPRCARGGDAYTLSFPGTAQVWMPTAGDLQVWQHPDASAEAVRHVLLDHVMPRVLANTGALVLHGSAAVTPKGACVVLLADSGTGKSTLGAGILLAGGQLLTDDTFHLSRESGVPMVVPTCYGLRLWPDSLHAMFGTDAPSEPMAHNSTKRRLPARPSALPPVNGTPVDAIFVLDPTDTAAGFEAMPLTPSQACVALIRNSFRLDLGGTAGVQGTLAEAAKVAASVPVLSLRYRRDYATLPALVDHLEHVALAYTDQPAASADSAPRCVV